MRIIITGQPGTKKVAFVESLRRYSLKQKGLEPDATQLEAVCKKQCQWFEVESKKWLRVDFLNYLTGYNESAQSRQWEDSLKAILTAIESDPAADCFLLVHTTFYRNGHFFSPISWDRLLLFQPDCIITLIDDIYDVWQRIEDGEYDTHYSLDEILTWRSVEISNARSLARNLRLDPTVVFKTPPERIPKRFSKFFGPAIPHFVMSVKHSLETFHRLLFEREKRPLVYASFPITRTRGSQERIADIDGFRRDLHKTGAIVVDPLTIDELRMSIDNPRWLDLKDSAAFLEYQATRWKIDEPVIAAPPKYTNPFANLSNEQISKIASSIWDQVVDRDFRMVAQCDRLVAYRPFYPEKGQARFGVFVYQPERPLKSLS